jgi:hypothetical protein
LSIGLPTHPPRGAVSRSFVHAEHAAALLCLIGALSCTVALHFSLPSVVLWPAILALVPMTAALLILAQHRTLLCSIVYLLVGVFGVYGYTVTYAMISGFPSAVESAVLSFPMLAVMLVGGPGSRPLEIIGWCTTAFAFAEAASLTARQLVGAPMIVDPFMVSAYLGVIAILLLARTAARRAAATSARFGRAAEEDLAFTVRVRAESQATAAIHDTVLNHLAVVAASAPGPLSDDLRQQVEQDIASLDTGDWLGPVAQGDGRPDRDAPGVLPPGIRGAVSVGSALGLEVALTGVLPDLALLSDEQDGALGLAVTQCLVNVQKHSGTRLAEIAVHRAADELVVMVIDGGQGFDVTRVGADRMGLRSSIRGRIESVGGTVQIWSTPGRGTSVILRLPLPGPTDPDALDGASGGTLR